MSLETWKSMADWATIVFVALTVVSGSAALILGDRINDKQAERLRKFDEDLIAAKRELSKQQERAASAEKELLRLKNPRSLSLGAVAILKGGSHGKAIIQCLVDVPETKMFASNLYGALLNAGWDMSPSPSIVPVKSFNVDVALSDVFVLGRTIKGSDNDDPTTPVGAFFKALKKDGYRPGAMLNTAAGDDTLIILVSHRP